MGVRVSLAASFLLVRKSNNAETERPCSVSNYSKKIPGNEVQDAGPGVK